MENNYHLIPSQSDDAISEPVLEDLYLEPVSAGIRFIHYFIDLIGLFLMGIVAGVILTILGLDAIVESIPDQVLGIVLLFLYYVLLEGISGRTLGKLITGTKVVTLEGEEPSFNTIVKRTLCRLIPFEAFSFLTSNVSGWHDRYSNTMVVRIRK